MHYTREGRKTRAAFDSVAHSVTRASRATRFRERPIVLALLGSPVMNRLASKDSTCLGTSLWFGWLPWC
jgi:hypothetical protein